MYTIGRFELITSMESLNNPMSVTDLVQFSCAVALLCSRVVSNVSNE